MSVMVVTVMKFAIALMVLFLPFLKVQYLEVEILIITESLYFRFSLDLQEQLANQVAPTLRQSRKNFESSEC